MRKPRQPKPQKEPEPVATDAEFTVLWDKANYAARKKWDRILAQINVSVRAGRKILRRPNEPALYVQEGFLVEARRLLGPVAQRIRALLRLLDARYHGPDRLKRAYLYAAAWEMRQELSYERAVQAEANKVAEADNWRRINSLARSGTKDLPPQSIALLRYAHAVIGEHIKDNKPIDDPIGLLDDLVDYLSMSYEPKTAIAEAAAKAADHAQLLSDTRELPPTQVLPTLPAPVPSLSRDKDADEGD